MTGLGSRRFEYQHASDQRDVFGPCLVTLIFGLEFGRIGYARDVGAGGELLAFL